MRSVTRSDVVAAARVLRGAPEGRRGDLCCALFRSTEIADRFTRRLGKRHPLFGRGTLTEAAMAFPDDTFDGPQDAELRRCMAQVQDHLSRRPYSLYL